MNDNSIVPFDPKKTMKVWQVEDNKRTEPFSDMSIKKANKLDVEFDIYVAEEGTPDGFSKSVATIKINTINGKPATDIDTVQVRYVTSAATGDIFMFKAETKHFAHNVGLDGEDTLCTTLVCKVREVVSKKLNQMKDKAKESKIFQGCSGKPFGWWRRPEGHGRRPNVHVPEGERTHRYHGERPHGSHHGRPHHGGFHQDKEWSMTHRRPHHDGFFATMSQVLLPVFIGIAAGIMVSLVCVLLMQISIFAYRKIRGTSDYQHLDEETAKGLLDEEEEAYTDEPPVYEESPEVVVSEKAEH